MKKDFELKSSKDTKEIHKIHEKIEKNLKSLNRSIEDLKFCNLLESKFSVEGLEKFKEDIENLNALKRRFKGNLKINPIKERDNLRDLFSALDVFLNRYSWETQEKKELTIEIKTHE